MALKLFNTLGRKTEEFVPIHEGTVGMYNCGPTVYNYAHIGNLRAYVFADILRRTLEYNGYKVKQVVNLTDVGHLVSDADEGEDKMEKGARMSGKTAKEIAEFYAVEFFKDLAKLNVEKAEVYPKATEHIPEQLALIKTLEEKGFTYRTSDGIYFDTKKFLRYGDLAGLDIENLREGARVEANAEKRNPTDFALWKFSKSGEKRQQEWDSPWGIGFPGWHLECSAMSMKYLGETFDIHTGGIDHIPVHHTNEIAQAECATGKKFVNVWMHSGFVNIEGEKMAKSEGNFARMATLEEKGISPLAYRYWLLTAHYTKTINFTWDAVSSAQTAFLKLHEFFVSLGEGSGIIDEHYRTRFLDAINDDLDTPKTIALVWELVRDITVLSLDKKATLLDMDKVLGFGLSLSTERLLELGIKTGVGAETLELPMLVQNLIAERELARTNKNWERSDALRAEIAEMGYKVMDTPDGVKVSKI